jgi:hypothetical protein
MSDKLPPGHGVDAHKDKVGKVMHEFKRGQLRSGTSKKGKKGPVVKSRAQAIAIGLNYSQFEQLQALGYSEESAWAFAEMAAKFANEGPLSDIDSKPGKQPGNSGKRKENPQEMATTFPTLPKTMGGGEKFAEGPMIKAKKGSCPTGTKSVGAGFCRNTKPGKRQYFEIEKGKSCPPGSKSAGSGRCRVNFAEFADGGVEALNNTPCPEKKSPAEKQAEKAQRGTQPTTPTPTEKKTAEPVKPLAGEDLEKRRAAKERAERCAKQAGN